MPKDCGHCGTCRVCLNRKHLTGASNKQRDQAIKEKLEKKKGGKK